MNYAHFAGRLGRDAEMRHTQSGQAVLNFSLAVDIGWGDKKETLWVDCALWGERGEKLAEYLTKGKSITVSGDVGLRTFEKRDGGHGSAITCNVQRLTLQGNGEARQEAPVAEPAPRAERAPKQRELPAVGAAPAGGVPFNDDIPF